jgi:hypothetical protein
LVGVITAATIGNIHEIRKLLPGRDGGAATHSVEADSSLTAAPANPPKQPQQPVGARPQPGTPTQPPRGEANPSRGESGGLYVPVNVTRVWVMFQEHGPEKSSPCRTHDSVTREEFVSRFEEFRQEAKRENVRMIVTARGQSEGQWFQLDMNYRGQPLDHTWYTCNGVPNEGAEVPLN